MNTQDTVNQGAYSQNNEWHKIVLCLSLAVVWLGFALAIFVTDAVSNELIHNSTTLGSSKWGGDWGTATGKYGEFDCNTCHDRNTGNIKRIKTSINAPNGTDQFPIEADSGTITFNATTGTNSFGDDAGEHTTSNKICEGCHSQNKYHNYNTANNTDGFTHENQKDCIACHSHSNGFGASCDTCHGNPPVTANLDSTGLVFDPEVTNATNPASPGAHELHAVTEGMSCTTCHKGNTMPTVSMTIQVGFEASNGNWTQFVGYNSGGNLDAPNEAGGANMSASYEFVSADGGATTITKVANNDLNCTVYCHGNWSGSAGSNTTPSWVGGSGEASCGACHGATAANQPTAGSHTTHASSGGLNLACTKCHPTVSDATHLDGSVAWSLATADPMFGGSATYDGSASGSTGAVAQGVAYSKCANVYCHAPGTPTWGGTVSCGDCHNSNKNLPDSHAVHYNSATNGDTALATKVTGDTSTYVYQCGSCHHSAPHSDGSKDVLINANWDTNGVAADNWNGTDTCSGTYCHSDGVGNTDNTPTDPVWASTVMSCSSCHKAQPTTQRHAVHTSDATYDFNCAECHVVTTTNGTSINDKDQHVDKSKDVDWGTISSGGTAYVAANDACDGIYCHSDGQGGASNTAVQWDTATTLTCTGCHDGASAGTGLSGSHEEHIVNASGTVGWNLNCHECHDDTTQTDNSTLNATTGYANHVDKQVDIKIAIDGTTCSDISCHSNGNFGGTTFAYNSVSNYEWGVDALGCDSCHGDGAGKSYPTYSDGGIGEDSNSHATHIVGPGYTCEECHNTTATGNALKTGGTTQHVDQTIDVAGSQFSWNGGTETCSNIVCHFNGSAQWGDSLGCADCHGNPPNTNAHLTHAGSGAGEYGLACSICHPEDHDGTVTDINFTGVAATWGTETYTSSSKTCSNLYCHGGATADWDAGTGGDCGDCHGAAITGRPDGANEPSGGSHLTSSHQVACNNCHSHDGTDVTEHVNGPAATYGDALVNSAGLQVTGYVYNATSSHALSPDPDGFDYTRGTCSTSCHSDGVWGSTGGCTFCHGGSDLYYPQGASAPDRIAEHAAHIYALETKLGYAHGTTVDAEQKEMCEYCHNDSNGVGGAGHNDGGVAEVGAFNPMWDIGTNDADGVLDAGKTCSNIDCHYSTTTADTWYGSGDADCAYCHADGVAAYTAGDLPDRHDSHVDEWPDGRDKTCVICHSGASGYAMDHANGSSNGDVAFSGSTTYTYNGDQTCSSATNNGLGCHATGTPDWGVSFAISSCTNCHTDTTTTAVNPNSGLHKANPTISGQEHDQTLGTGCVECHTVAALSTHANGTFSGNGTTDRTAMGLPDTAGNGYVASADGVGSCVGTWLSGCHGASAAPNNGDAGTWARRWDASISYDPFDGDLVECAGCHGGFTDDWTFGGNNVVDDGSVSHMRDWEGSDGAEVIGNHKDGANKKCNVCHVYDDTEYNWSNHRDDQIDMNSSMNYSSTNWNCTSTCHSDNTGHNLEDSGWNTGAVAGPALACGTCHQDGVTDTVGSDSHMHHGATVGDMTAEDGSDCEKCHGNNSGSGYSSTTVGSHGDGTLTFDFSPDNASYGGGENGQCSNVDCHANNLTPQWDTDATIGCVTCHSNVTTHVKVLSSQGSDSACTECHPGGAYAPTAHSNNGKTDIVLINNLASVGIDYSLNGEAGVYLGGDSAMSRGASEAEICWGCHYGSTNNVSEWGPNQNVSTGNILYNAGHLDDESAGWPGAVWTSAVNGDSSLYNGVSFAYKTSTIESTHSANTSAATNGVDGVEDIRCSYCHDVHDTAGSKGLAYDVDGEPYLRGNWLSNPYREDGAPQPSTTWTVNGNLGNVPRGGTGTDEYGGFQIDQNNGNPTALYNATQFGGLCDLCHGGTGTKDGRFDTSEIASLNYYGTDDGAGWVSGENGHANSVKDGSDSLTDSAAQNIFSAKRRHPGYASSVDLMYADSTGSDGHRPLMSYYGATINGTLGSSEAEGWGFRGLEDGSSYFRAAGYQPTPSAGNKLRSYQVYNWAAVIDADPSADGTAEASYHQFSCSKCHNPHASRLPKLMISNCLDTKHNTWDNSAGITTSPSSTDTNEAGNPPVAYNQSKTWSNTTSAINCHRYRDPRTPNSSGTATIGAGWNYVTPWSPDSATDQIVPGDYNQSGYSADGYTPATSPTSSGM